MLESTVYIKIDKIIKEYRNWSKNKECRNPDPQLSYAYPLTEKIRHTV